ncbi:MAG: hypothetical protein Q8K64_08150 [Sediminibacterium sp.]|nr:hypothetical protein [Sediminibacterium sp.]
MALYRTGDNLFQSLEAFIENSSGLFIFVPYIKLNTLELLLKNNTNCKSIIVRWETRDLILGASDLEVYDYCKEKEIKLFRNTRLHLKAFVDDYKKCYLGSANISGRALNMPERRNYNYELATIENNLDFNDRLYFNIILNEATLITDSIYEQIKAQLPEKKEEFPDEDDFNIQMKLPDKDFLISSLPMSSSVKTLTRVYLEKKGIHEEELNCAMHDLALYNIPLNLSEDHFIQKLKESFFSHLFIKAFIQMLQLKNGEIYFGEAKAWIQNNCTNVPTPRRWEITENIQILYKWFVELGDGIFIVDQPNYSERLSLLNQSN